MSDAAADHLRFDADDLSTGDTYRLMTGLVTPRPIAWISTCGVDGRHNLAPFSYFQAVCSRPPTVVLGFGARPDGTPKDTLRNVLQTRQLVINHVSEPLAEAMNRTSGTYPTDVDEWDIAQGDDSPRLPSLPSHHVAPPRIALARAAMECRMTHAIPLGEAPHGGPSSTLVVARVLCFHVRPDLVLRDAKGRISDIDAGALASIGRLGGIAYATTNERFELPRPKVP